MRLPTCVDPAGHFIYGIHRSRFVAENLRRGDFIAALGRDESGRPVDNRPNFPPGPVEETAADWVYEIPNPLPFRGTTYISRHWADRCAARPETIRLPSTGTVSFHDAVARNADTGGEAGAAALDRWFTGLPAPLRLALATTSSDPRDLERLAALACRLDIDPATGRPRGMVFRGDADRPPQPEISDRALFEAVANNPHLPADYRRAMVLRPGVQGSSQIVGEWPGANGTHVFEYLRRNSYIPWGHFAANMADDAVRYRLQDLTLDDMRAMRRLYYQRTYVRLARETGAGCGSVRRPLSDGELEGLRRDVLARLAGGAGAPPFTAALWGWNFGFDFAPSGYRLHASHQQVHQQYALVPSQVAGGGEGGPIPSYSCGDLVADFVHRYRRRTGADFFDCYLRAVRGNRRLEGAGNGEDELVVAADRRAVLFVPKAQTSQWELQLVPAVPVGNVLEADESVRRSLDRLMWIAVRVLGALGARMITTIEYGRRFDDPNPDQRLLYSFLPRLPHSPGAFSEAQLRWINRHYPEDFAAACRANRPADG